MRRLSKILLALTLIVLCFILMPDNANAAEVTNTGICGGNLIWSLDSEGTLTIFGTGAMANYSYSSKSPSRSDHPWSQVANSIKKVVISEGATSIGSYAFYNCSSLTSITIPDSVTSIGYDAFSNCRSLTSITIPDSVTSIGSSAFSNCSSLTSITIPDSVTSIGSWTFFGCSSLTSITIPDSVTSIGHYAFSNCKGLTSVVIPDSVTSIGSDAFSNCSSLTSITIPDSVTSIGDCAFSNCSSLTSITIGNGVTSIGHQAFFMCSSLTSITIPATVTAIGDAAFADCTKLESVYISDIAAWCEIEFYDFDSTPLRYVDKLYVNGNPVTELVIPDGVTRIREFAFYSYAGLTGVTIPASVSEIGARAFAACVNLTSIRVAADNPGYSSDNQGVLYNKSRTALIQAPGTIVSCAIPGTVTTIGEYAFRSCANLRTVSIPSSVTTIGSYAFNYCHGLRGVYISDLAAWCQIDFGSFSANPLNYANVLYMNKKAVTELVIPADITEIKDFAFFNCKSLTKVMLPKGMTEIGEKAFYNCLNITTVGIPGSMKTIGEEAFYSCAALECVYFCDGDLTWSEIDIHSSNTYLLEAPRSHGWEDYVCRNCGLERVDNALVYYGVPGLSFQDYIGMQIMVRNADVEKFDKVFVIAIQEGPDGPVKTRLQGIPFYGAYQVFDQQVLSWSMTEKVTMILCGEKDGVVYRGEAISGSVQSLAMQMILNSVASDPVKCRMLVDMLNYGSAVQTAFNYNAENLPNADLGELAALGTTDIPSLNATNSVTGEAEVPALVNNISLQAKVEIQLLFMGDVSAYTPKATVNGENVDVLFDGETYPGFTVLRVAIKATQMRETFTVALYDGEGNPVSQIYNVSAEGYATARQGGDYSDADIAMMRYGDSVKAFARA